MTNILQKYKGVKTVMKNFERTIFLQTLFFRFLLKRRIDKMNFWAKYKGVKSIFLGNLETFIFLIKMWIIFYKNI